MDRKIIEYKGHRILTTAQLAESYGTDGDHIGDNFQNNKARFVEGKHFFELKGEELREFKNRPENFGVVGKNANTVKFWTEKGAWLHAKSLNTDRAWEAYEMLVDDYYAVKETKNTIVPSYMLEDPEARAIQWIAEFREKKELEQQKALLEKTITEYKPKIAYLDTILQSKGTVTTSQIAKDYGLTAPALNKILHEEGVQFKQNKQWLLYKKYADKGYTQSYTIPIERSDGTPDITMNTRWTQAGRVFIHGILEKREIKANIDKNYFDAK